MEKVAWKVDGMTCANCALSINRTLDRQGLKNVSVNVITGDVSFETGEGSHAVEQAKKKVEHLGYKVNEPSMPHQHHGHGHDHDHDHDHSGSGMSKYLVRFWICLPFTVVLMLHMIPGLHWRWLMLPWVQFGLALPVFIVGMEYFGRSAWKSLLSGIPNMNVLIALGAISAFAYSTYGLFTNKPQDFLFFETAASIITIVLFGYWLEDISVARTQREIKKLSRQQVVKANMIAYDDKHEEHIFPVDNTALKVGDLVLIRTGEQVPGDCKILSGDAEVNEALITGESVPVFRQKGDLLIGGSVMVNGNVKAYITAVGKDTVMSSIVALMTKAQTEKPPVQQLADKISAVFVPAILAIAAITLLGNMVIGEHDFRESLMRSVAVLVIACPCAMGLATPAAIAVGLGRAARNGILFTDVKRMELFRNVRQVVFDKTGTLTTGKFAIQGFQSLHMPEENFRNLVYSLEKFSNHPIAQSIAEVWKTRQVVRMQQVKEEKGIGMQGEDREGNVWRIGSAKVLDDPALAGNHQLYVTRNGEQQGWIDIADEIRPEAKAIIGWCKAQGIKTILLSGDNEEKCATVANALGMDEYYAGQTPPQKLQRVEQLSKTAPTVMVGDGINDAPALAKATISVSLSQASELAIQSASVVLTSGGLRHLPMAMSLGRLTYGTVKSNLFWAFAYNIIAIPVAAMGFLHPSMSALIMGGSDVVLALNSLWLGVRKID